LRRTVAENRTHDTSKNAHDYPPLYGDAGNILYM
jgi:hypothetical protein